MPHVITNYQRRIGIELRRSATSVTCIIPTEGGVKELKSIPLEFNRSGPLGEKIPDKFDSHWHPVEYPVAMCALSWLRNKQFSPIKSDAEREVVMIVLIDAQSRFLAKFADTDLSSAKALAGGKNQKACVFSDVSELLTLKGSKLVEIYNNVIDGAAMSRCRDKQKVAEAVWSAIENAVMPELVRPVSTTTEKGVKRMGIKAQIRTMMEDGQSLTVEELMERTGGTKSNITTAISDLRSPKYCGKGEPLNIAKSDSKEFYLESRVTPTEAGVGGTPAEVSTGS